MRKPTKRVRYVQQQPGPKRTSDFHRCIICRETRMGPVASLPNRGPTSKQCICLPCMRSVDVWFRKWRRHIDEWEKRGTLLIDEPSARVRVVS